MASKKEGSEVQAAGLVPLTVWVRAEELMSALRALPEAVSAAASEKAMTVKEVAKLLGTSPKAVYSLNRRGNLPGAFRIGPKIIRVRRDELLGSLRKGRVPSRRTRR